MAGGRGGEDGRGRKGGGGRKGRGDTSGRGDPGASCSRTVAEQLAAYFQANGVTEEDANRMGPLMDNFVRGLRGQLTEKAIADALAMSKKRKATTEDSPGAKEKRLRREAREEERQRKATEATREEERLRLPVIALTGAGGVSDRSYEVFRGALQHVLHANFRIDQEWGKKTKKEQELIRMQLKAKFRNGGLLSDMMLSEKISKSLCDRRNHEREKMRKYLKAEPLPAARVREKGVPDLINPDAWNAWLEEELQLRAWE